MELQELDRKTRKLMTIHRGLAKRADVDRLYTKRHDGGRGLLNIEESVKLEEQALATYMQKDQTKKASENTNVQELKKSMAKSRKDGWRNKALLGQYLRQLDEETDVAKTFK